MKYFLSLTTLSIFITIFFSCNTKTAKIENTVITFEKNIYDFDSIATKQYVEATFNFTNTGEQPLFIQDVKTTCGCTVPEYSLKIIKPNNKGEIKVVYNAKHLGNFNKTVFVHYNGISSPQKLIIKGKVIPRKKFD